MCKFWLAKTPKCCLPGPFGTSSARGQVARANGRPLLQRGVLHVRWHHRSAPRCQQPTKQVSCLCQIARFWPSVWPTKGGHAMGLANQPRQVGMAPFACPKQKGPVENKQGFHLRFALLGRGLPFSATTKVTCEILCKKPHVKFCARHVAGARC